MYSYKTPDRTYAKDLQDAIRTGDVTGSSFGFSIEDEEWVWANKRTDGGKKDLRIIKKLKRLYDVSPVTYPAYQDTSVAKRSMTEAKGEHEAARTGYSSTDETGERATTMTTTEKKGKSLEFYKRKQKLMQS
jgi:phage head maturation protease